jgi:type IV pilus assembly protein PilW
LQLEYGVDSGNDNLADAYQPASGSLDWGKVVSVRFSLLMQAVGGKLAGGGGQAINYNGSAVTADGRLRQKFGTVVAVRNRVP